jgi:hypothetical protein
MCGGFDLLLLVPRWPLIACGLLLGMGCLLIAWKRRQLVEWHQRSVSNWLARLPKNWYGRFLTGYYLMLRMSPQTHRLVVVLSAGVGIIMGAFLLGMGICGRAAP